MIKTRLIAPIIAQRPFTFALRQPFDDFAVNRDHVGEALIARPRAAVADERIVILAGSVPELRTYRSIAADRRVRPEPVNRRR